MIAYKTQDILVESRTTYCNIHFLNVRLRGENHYSMYQDYRNLPDVIECEGVKYGKSCWDSDKGLVYYRSDKLFANCVS